MLVIAGHIRIDPARRDAAVAAAAEVQAETRKEPGCLSYAFSSDLDDEGLFHLFEEWESEDALDAHFATPHIAVFQGKVAGLGVKEMNVKRYEIASVGPLGG